MKYPRSMIYPLLFVGLGLGCTGEQTVSETSKDMPARMADQGVVADQDRVADQGQRRDRGQATDQGEARDEGRANQDSGVDLGPNATLSARYPGDRGLAQDPAVLFFDDFEEGWGRWDRPSEDTRYLTMQSDQQYAHSGSGYLRSKVTRADLEETMYISSQSSVAFPPQEEIYWRFHVRFPELAPNPHHWVRVEAGAPGWSGSGRANTVPPGDEGFWFDFDINNNDAFNFYVYWYNMRSGRCNNGSTTPGCEGDQGNTYHYGNTFQPPDQRPYPRDTWFCVEMRAKANTVGSSNGELEFWIDDQPVGRYAVGEPEGTWLRDRFHTGGCEFSACTDPMPFEGFDFRSDSSVQFKRVILDAYYERGSSSRKRQTLEDRGLTVSDDQVIDYDDVVVATERIGCRR